MTGEAGPWYVYIVQCRDGSLYTGIAKDLERRIHEHNNSKTGAKYTRSRRPVTLVYFEQTVSRARALSKEYRIRQLSPPDKADLILKDHAGRTKKYAKVRVAQAALARLRGKVPPNPAD